MKYVVIRDWQRDAFLSKVRELISDGWRPQGGVSIAYDGSNTCVYAQAFVRDH